MTSNGDGKTEKTGKNNGESKQQKGYIMNDQGGKNEMQEEEEVVFQKTEQGAISTRQSGLDKYWTAVKNGASGTLAQVKEEKVTTANSFDALNEEENEWEEEMEMESDFQEEGKGREIHSIKKKEVEAMKHSDVAETLYTYYLGKRLGATRKVYYLLEETEAKKQLVELVHQHSQEMEVEPKKYSGNGRNVQTIHLTEIDKMKHQDIAETLYGYDIQQNKNVMREEYYSMEEKKAKVQLIQLVNMIQKNNFLSRIHKVIDDIKALDVSLTTKEMGQAIIMEVCELSEIKYIKCKTDAATRKKLYQYQEYIAMIEKFIKDPVMIIPDHMLQLGNASDIQVVEADYFKLVLAVVVAKVSEDGTTQLTMRQLRIKAMKLKRSIQKEQNTAMDTNEQKPPKKPKTGNNDGKQAKTLNSEYQQQKQEMKEQDLNMRGVDVETVIPNEEEVEGPNFSLPVKEKKVAVIQKEKTEFMIHNKIHVTEKAQAHKIVQMVFRVLRRADPTVNIMPFKKEEKTQNNNLDQEDQIPETEEDLSKWIDIAKFQLKDKFGFSMRISITEPKEVVKRRIFQWCRGKKHYIEFKRLTSANIFFAGWLYHIHPKYHNRDDVRDWMANSDTVLKDDIHLAPGRIFKTLDDDEKTTLITHGLRVEVTFERREAVLKALFSLNWENGPYRKSCFVPYRKNENYTDEMQEKFIKQHQQYIKNTKQTVFRMKAPRWKIQNKLEGRQTTFQKWIQSSRVNNEKIVDSLEIGDDEYVRIIYQQQHDQGIKLLMRNLQNETERTFGKEVREKLFSSSNGGPITGTLAALEEDYAHKLEKVLGSSNPQNDDDDYVPAMITQTRSKNHVYFGNQVDETFADKVRNKKTSTNTNKDEKNGDKKMESKKEILDEVNELIDKRMEKFEKKVNKSIKTITEKQDEKISSLEELVTTNYKKSEAAAKKRNDEIKEHMNSHKFFMENLAKHFQLPMNPPHTSVEQSSHVGGSEK